LIDSDALSYDRSVCNAFRFLIETQFN